MIFTLCMLLSFTVFCWGYICGKIVEKERSDKWVNGLCETIIDLHEQIARISPTRDSKGRFTK